MKTPIYLLLLILSISLMLPLKYAYAQEDTSDTESTITPANSDSESTGIKEKINDLKERLATKVAELREQNKRSFYGVIKELDETKMTLLYRDEEIPVVLDDKTTFYSINSNRKRIDGSIDDYELGETAVIFGTLDLDGKTVVASYSYSQQLPIINQGIISKIDEDDGSFSIDSNSGTLTLDYEISTQCIYFKNDIEIRCGLTLMNIGDRALVRLKPEAENLSRATVLRVLLIPQPAITPESN